MRAAMRRFTAYPSIPSHPHTPLTVRYAIKILVYSIWGACSIQSAGCAWVAGFAHRYAPAQPVFQLQPSPCTTTHTSSYTRPPSLRLRCIMCTPSGPDRDRLLTAGPHDNGSPGDQQMLSPPRHTELHGLCCVSTTPCACKPLLVRYTVGVPDISQDHTGDKINEGCVRALRNHPY